MSVSKPTTLTRYCLFQIPGVVIAAALAWAAAHWFSVPIWAGILAVSDLDRQGRGTLSNT